jgi:hypothetical protein
VSRYDREERYRNLGWMAFAASIASFLAAAWTFDQRWLATAFVLLFTSLVLSVARADFR